MASMPYRASLLEAAFRYLNYSIKRQIYYDFLLVIFYFRFFLYRTVRRRSLNQTLTLTLISNPNPGVSKTTARNGPLLWHVRALDNLQKHVRTTTKP